MQSHAATVQQQFDPQAQAYLTSAVHAAGPDLQHADALLARTPDIRTALDVGCGAGHMAFLLARHVAQVVATDPSPSMLDAVQTGTRERGITSIATRQAGAEALPFESGAFDLVATRYSAHHWLELPRALTEMRRVLRPGGTLLVIDLLGDETPLVDTWLQAIEVMRDPSHVRDRTATQWRELIATAGFSLQHEACFPLRLEFASWIARMRTPSQIAAAIRHLQQGAPQQVCEGLAFEADGSFAVRTGLFCATNA